MHMKLVKLSALHKSRLYPQEKSSVLIYKLKIKWSRYRPGVAQRVGRGIAVLFHDRGTRREWVVVSSTLRPQFTPGKDPVPILLEAGRAPRPVWRGGKTRPHRDSIPDRPARSQSLYQLSCPAHTVLIRTYRKINTEIKGDGTVIIENQSFLTQFDKSQYR